MYEALDISPGGEQYLPLAQHFMRRLKEVLQGCGLEQGRKHFATPDGTGSIYLRTRRDSGVWYDYIKIEAGVGGGYITRLNLAAYVGSGYSPLSISIYGNKSFKPFLGYNYPLALAPQFPTQNIVTSGVQTAGTVRGYFSRQKFTPFAVGGSTVLGAFVHKYTDADGADQKRILTLDNSLQVIDTTTGSVLSVGGASIPAGWSNTTYTVSADGRALIIEGAVNVDAATPTRTRILRLDVDFQAEQQVTRSALPAEATPQYRTAGSWVFVKSPEPYSSGPFSAQNSSVFSNTSANPYNGVFGLGANGGTRAIVFTDRQESSGTSTQPLDEFPYNDQPGNVTYAPPNTYTWNLKSDVTTKRHVDVALPGGATAAFLLEDSTTSTDHWEFTTDQINYTATGKYTYLGTVGVLGIIYADATIPILFYEQHKTIITLAADAPATDHSGVSRPYQYRIAGGLSGSAQFVREIGVLYGSTHRVLFTETSAPVTSGTASKVGFKSVLVSGDYSFFGGESAVALDASSYVYDTTTPGAPLPFFKKLKSVTDFDSDPERSTPMNGNVLFMHDVGHFRFSPANEPYFWVGVRDKDHWILGVRRLKDIDGNTINDLQLYAGGLDEAKLRQNYLDYLTAAGEAKDPPDATFLATLAAGGFGAYDVGLAGQSRIPMV